MDDNLNLSEQRREPAHLICFKENDDNALAMSKRAAVLFDGEPVEDPILHYVESKESPTSSGRIRITFGRFMQKVPPRPFKIVPSHFIERARLLAPKEPKPTASGFSEWVYSIYAENKGDESDLKAGLEAEAAIFNQRKAHAAGCVDQDFLKKNNSAWELIHCGLRIDSSRSPHFAIPELNFEYEIFRACPDLIYRNRATGEVIIVEIKFSRLPLTTNLWPNVWAQLWCYSRIPVVTGAQNVRVIGEVWGTRLKKSNYFPSRRSLGEYETVLRASVQRNPRARSFDRFFGELFEIYRGRAK